MVEEKEDGLAAVQQRFRAYYEANLRGDYNGLEPVRQKYLRQFRRRLAICVAVAGAYVAFCTVRQLNPEVVFSENALWIYFVFLSVAGAWVTCPSSHYKKDSKKLVMNKILAFWGNMRYSEKGSDITWDSLVQSCLFGSFDGRDVDDDLAGTYNGTDIKISEQHLTRLVRTRRGSRRQTVFRGIIIVLETGKKFSGQTVVRVDRGWFNFLTAPLNGKKKNANGSVTASFFFKSSLERVQLEDPVFEREWEVYAEDQVEARYLLTPALMERMLEIKRRFFGQRIEFSFFNNRVMIAVQTGQDMFETTSLFLPAPFYGKMREVVTQLYSVFAAADLINGQRI